MSSSPTTEPAAEQDICPQSIRVDGPYHSWVFDGDDPRVCCVFCGEMRDALTGRVIQPGEPAQAASRPSEPRPSRHDPITKSYAIDQVTDIEHLRAVAHRMWEAFAACHAQEAHVLAAILNAECDECCQAFVGERETCCEKYQAWQRLITDGFGSV